MDCAPSYFSAILSSYLSSWSIPKAWAWVKWLPSSSPAVMRTSLEWNSVVVWHSRPMTMLAVAFHCSVDGSQILVLIIPLFNWLRERVTEQRQIVKKCWLRRKAYSPVASWYPDTDVTIERVLVKTEIQLGSPKWRTRATLEQKSNVHDHGFQSTFFARL